MEGFNIIEQNSNDYYQGKLGILINEMFTKLKLKNINTNTKLIVRNIYVKV